MSLRLNGSTSGYSEIDAPAIAGNNTLVLPTTNGAANQLLKNGSTPGVLEYASMTLDSSGNLNSVASINGGPLAGFRNRIINGDFDIWRRSDTFTASGYGADRWIHARTNSTQTVTRQAFALGQTDVPNGPVYFCRTVVVSVTGAANTVNLQQRIESVRTFAGQQVTVSFWAKASATRNIAIDLRQSFGTGGSPSSTVSSIGVTKVAINTSWQKITATINVPSISGKVLGTNNDNFLQLTIFFDAGSDFNSRTDTLGHQSGTFDIAQVQMEAGATATTFEQRFIGTEVALCQRYYTTTDAEFRFDGFLNSGGGDVGVGYTWFLPVEMRALPSVNVLSQSGAASGGISGITAKSTNGIFAIWPWTNTGGVIARSKAAVLSADAEL